MDNGCMSNTIRSGAGAEKGGIQEIIKRAGQGKGKVVGGLLVMLTEGGHDFSLAPGKVTVTAHAHVARTAKARIWMDLEMAETVG